MSTEDQPLRIPPEHPSAEGGVRPDDSLADTSGLKDPDAQAESAIGSNPNSSGEAGLSGGMGVSSERTGPEGHDPRIKNPIEGTGSKGSAVTRTDGGFDTSPAPRTVEDVQGEEQG